MQIQDINRLLSEGRLDEPGLFPHLEALASLGVTFRQSFGLDHLPEGPGLLIIRGARQYGKSTWLEGELKKTIQTFGPGSALYLNGDDLKDEEDLLRHIEDLVPVFASNRQVKRLFIDEITAVGAWEKAFKRAADRGLLRQILVVSTGSRAADLRRGAERLPGRKGRLARTQYLFTPLPYWEFSAKAKDRFAEKTVLAYLLSGGCPIACHDMIMEGRLSEDVISMVRDWIFGECYASGRDRASLLSVFDILIKTAGNPVGQTSLAREAGLANNTVAAGYIGLLSDLMVALPCLAWDSSRNSVIRRKPGKFHFINLLAAVAWHPAHLRSPEDFERLAREEQAKFWEWLVAQELWRRSASAGQEFPDGLRYWAAGGHEIDFVTPEKDLIEVKRGSASPLDFLWFPKSFPKKRLTLVNEKSFETSALRGLTMEEFLLDPGLSVGR